MFRRLFRRKIPFHQASRAALHALAAGHGTPAVKSALIERGVSSKEVDTAIFLADRALAETLRASGRFQLNKPYLPLDELRGLATAYPSAEFVENIQAYRCQDSGCACSHSFGTYLFTSQDVVDLRWDATTLLQLDHVLTRNKPATHLSLSPDFDFKSRPSNSVTLCRDAALQRNLDLEVAHRDFLHEVQISFQFEDQFWVSGDAFDRIVSPQFRFKRIVSPQFESVAFPLSATFTGPRLDLRLPGEFLLHIASPPLRATPKSRPSQAGRRVNPCIILFLYNLADDEYASTKQQVFAENILADVLLSYNGYPPHTNRHLLRGTSRLEGFPKCSLDLDRNRLTDVQHGLTFNLSHEGKHDGRWYLRWSPRPYLLAVSLDDPGLIADIDRSLAIRHKTAAPSSDKYYYTDAGYDYDIYCGYKVEANVDLDAVARQYGLTVRSF